MRLHIHTFGCKLNQYESEKIRAILIDYGYNFTTLINSEAIIINTCTVTKESDNKLFKYIDTCRKSKDIPIFLMGCYASKKDIASQLANNIIIIENNKKHEAHTIINNYLQKLSVPQIELANKKIFFPQEQSRAFLKIQDGCNVFCSYCIVSHIRGAPKSESLDNILRSIEEIATFGYREIVFTGINIASYMHNGIGFTSLLDNVIPLLIEKHIRLRLSSVEPFLFTDKLISLFSSNALCLQAHIPLQSASNKILSLMKRRYTKEKYRDIVKGLYSLNNRITITTDVMVGFPDELENDFNETVEFLEEMQFLKAHIFRYSKRENTEAYDYKNQVASRTKIIRAKKLNEINDNLMEYHKNRIVGLKVEVIIEKEIDENTYFGTTSEYFKVIVLSSMKLKKKMLVEGICDILDDKTIVVKFQNIK